MNTKIRPATPKDTIKIAPLIHMATANHLKIPIYNALFGTSTKETINIFERLLNAKTNSWFHWSHYIVADVNGDIAATACGYDEPTAGIGKFALALLEVLELGDADPIAFIDSLAPLHAVKPENPSDMWIIEHVATHPHYRGQGIVKKVIDAVIDNGRQRGFTKAQVTFTIGNEVAQRVYESLGFTIAAEYIDDSFEKTFGARGLFTYRRTI